MKKILSITAGVFMSALVLSSPCAAADFSRFTGEKITFAIKKFGFKAGDAELEFKGLVQKDGRELYLIVFRADGMNFFDEERIFAGKENFYPVCVERNLNIFGGKEQIVETYSPDGREVRIVKTAGDKTEEQKIVKADPLDNIYCFIYRYRNEGKFHLGDSFQIHLPTKDVTLSLKRETRIKAAGQVFDAFFMESAPAQYRVWFDRNKIKIPVRIDGAVGFGSTAMIMTAYQAPQREKASGM